MCGEPTFEITKWLKAHCVPLSLSELAEFALAGSLPDNAIALTFDDGYEDNLLDALPLLEEFEIPATFFLTTGGLARAAPYWWDVLEAANVELAVYFRPCTHACRRMANAQA